MSRREDKNFVRRRFHPHFRSPPLPNPWINDLKRHQVVTQVPRVKKKQEKPSYVASSTLAFFNRAKQDLEKESSRGIDELEKHKRRPTMLVVGERGFLPAGLKGPLMPITSPSRERDRKRKLQRAQQQVLNATAESFSQEYLRHLYCHCVHDARIRRDPRLKHSMLPVRSQTAQQLYTDRLCPDQLLYPPRISPGGKRRLKMNKTIRAQTMSKLASSVGY